MNNCTCNKNDELRIVRGNAFSLRLTVRALRIDGTPVEDFDLSQANAVLKVEHLGTKTEKTFTVIDNDSVIGFDNTLALGWYGLEMTGTYNDAPWRWYVEKVFCIVETNAKANIPAWAILTDDTYMIDVNTSITSGDIYQSDWAETNPQSPSYIQNKPNVVTHEEYDPTIIAINKAISDEETRAKAAEKANADDIDGIEDLIPAQATPQNQLADKHYVDDGISTASATYRGAYNLVSDLELTVAATEQQIAAALATKMTALGITPDNNDYCFVQVPTADATPTEIARVDRYKFNGTAWAFEFSLNNSGFTAAQWAALNSGITSGLVTKLSDLPTISELTTLLNGKEDKSNKVTSLSAESTDTQYPSAKCVYDLHKQNADDIDGIEDLIPAQATPQNQLADKQYVDDGISTASATYRGAYNLVSDLELTVAATEQQIAAALATKMTALGITPDNNDYCFVQVPTADATPTEIARVDRYKYNGTAWAFEFSLNNSGFTAAQWAALNSGITSGLVTKLSDLPTNSELTTLLAGKQDTINDLSDIRSGAAAGATAYQKPQGGIPKSDLESSVQTSLGKADTAIQDVTQIENDIDNIEKLIPQQATEQNQLADKQFVNSSISTATATYRGAYNLVSDLELTTAATEQQIAAALATKMTALGITPDNNDYCFVQVPTADATPTQIARVDRYKYNGTAWAFEFSLNNSGFTAAQWAAINSGATALLISKLGLLPTNAELTNMFNAITNLIPSEATTSNKLADKAYVLAQILAAIPSFKGQFTTLYDLQSVASPKNGDFGIVRTKDSDGYDVFAFYQYLNSQWNVFYTLSHHLLKKPASTGTTGDYSYNGMGRVVIQKNMVNNVNTLTQDAFEDGEGNPLTNTVFIIQYDFTLGEDITVPENCVLEFDGGSVSGEHTITGANTGINAGLVKIFNTDITIIGDWFIGSVYPEWFGATPDVSTADCAPAINKALQFSILGRFHKEVRFQGKRYYCKTHVKIETASDYYIKGTGNATLVASGEPMDYLFGRDGTGSSDAPGVSIRLSNITFDANYRCNYAIYMPCMSNSNWENVNCISAILCNFFTNYSFIDNFYGCKFYSGDPYGHPTKFDVFLGNQDCNALLFSGCDFEGAYIGAYTNSGYNVVFDTCTFEGLRATGIYTRKTECLNISNCYFEDISWNRAIDDPTNPRYINPDDLGVTFTSCYQYVSSADEGYTVRNINSFKVHANIIINFKSLELSEILNFQNLILGFWYHSNLLLSSRNSPRKCIINNNTFQHVNTKNIDNDCNIMCCGGEMISVNNNSTDAIYITSGGWGQLYTDYKAMNFVVPVVNSTITSGGFGLSGNANHSVIDNSISITNLNGGSGGARFSYSPIEKSSEKYPFKYIDFTDNNISIDDFFDVTFGTATTSSHTTNCLFNGAVRIKSGAFVCIETVVTNTTNDIVVIYLDNIEARIPIGTTKLFFYKKYNSDAYMFNLKVSNFNNGTLKFKMPTVQLVDGEIKEQVYYGTTSYRGNLAFKKKGEPFFDTTLNKPVYWNGTAWVDATGTPV